MVDFGTNRVYYVGITKGGNDDRRDIIEKLTTARVGLLLKHPFFGNMATRMKLIEADEWCPTAATNGRDFFYNTEFVKKLSVKKVMFLLAHEICHGIFDHLGRIKDHDRDLSNIAQDYAVNQILIDDCIGERITEVDICYDRKYKGWAWEEIYDSLVEEHGDPKENKQKMLSQLGDMLDEHLEEAMAGESESEDGKPVIAAGEMGKIRDEIKQASNHIRQVVLAILLPKLSGLSRN